MSSTAKARWTRITTVLRAVSRLSSAADREHTASIEDIKKNPIVSTPDSRKSMPSPIAESPSREAAASEVEPASDLDVPSITIVSESEPGTPVAVYSTLTREVFLSSDDNTTISSRDGDSTTGSVDRVRFREPLEDPNASPVSLSPYLGSSSRHDSTHHRRDQDRSQEHLPPLHEFPSNESIYGSSNPPSTSTRRFSSAESVWVNAGAPGDTRTNEIHTHPLTAETKNSIFANTTGASIGRGQFTDIGRDLNDRSFHQHFQLSATQASFTTSPIVTPAPVGPEATATPLALPPDNSALPGPSLDSATHIPDAFNPIHAQAATPVRDALPYLGLTEGVSTASQPVDRPVKDVYEVSDGASSLDDGKLGSTGRSLRRVSSMGSLRDPWKEPPATMFQYSEQPGTMQDMTSSQASGLIMIPFPSPNNTSSRSSDGRDSDMQNKITGHLRSGPFIKTESNVDTRSPVNISTLLNPVISASSQQTNDEEPRSPRSRSVSNMWQLEDPWKESVMTTPRHSVLLSLYDRPQQRQDPSASQEHTPSFDTMLFPAFNNVASSISSGGFPHHMMTSTLLLTPQSIRTQLNIDASSPTNTSVPLSPVVPVSSQQLESGPCLYNLGWMKYKLPDGTVYFTHPNRHITIDVDLLTDNMHKIITDFSERQSGSVPMGMEGMELWIRQGPESNQDLFIPIGYWVDHRKRLVQSLRENEMNWNTKGENTVADDHLDAECMYWSFVEAHPAHVSLPAYAKSEAMDVLAWAWADGLLPSHHISPAPFTEQECQNLMSLLRSFGNERRAGIRSVVQTSIVSRIFLRAVHWRRHSHPRQKPLPEGVNNLKHLIVGPFYACIRILRAFFTHRRLNGGTIRKMHPLLVIGACICLFRINFYFRKCYFLAWITLRTLLHPLWSTLFSWRQRLLHPVLAVLTRLRITTGILPGEKRLNP